MIRPEQVHFSHVCLSLDAKCARRAENSSAADFATWTRALGQSFASKLCTSLSSAYKPGERRRFSDFVIAVEPDTSRSANPSVEFPVHRALLMTRWSNFDRMVQNGMKELHDGRMCIKGFSVASVSALLEVRGRAIRRAINVR